MVDLHLACVSNQKFKYLKVFEIGGVTRLIRSRIINWKPGNLIFLYNLTRGASNHLHAAAKGLLGWLCQIKVTLGFFLSPASQSIKISRCILSSPRIPEEDFPRMA
jgi:hypothetical protein